MPLVRVEGKKFVVHPKLSMDAARFAAAAPLDVEARDQIARDAEKEYGLQPCLYFYAGYACPEFGDVVLAYDPEPSEARRGNASSFDTGGMFKAFIKGAGLRTADERRKHVAADLCVLREWRTRLDRWVAGHFDSIDSYLNGVRPAEDDSSGRLTHPENDRRAWTYEVRLHEKQQLFEDLAFAIVRQDFWQAALGVADSAERDRLIALYGREAIAVVDAAATEASPCTEATARIVVYVRTETGAAS